MSRLRRAQCRQGRARKKKAEVFVRQLRQYLTRMPCVVWGGKPARHLHAFKVVESLSIEGWGWWGGGECRLRPWLSPHVSGRFLASVRNRQSLRAGAGRALREQGRGCHCRSSSLQLPRPFSFTAGQSSPMCGMGAQRKTTPHHRHPPSPNRLVVWSSGNLRKRLKAVFLI